MTGQTISELLGGAESLNGGDPMIALSRDLRDAATNLSPREARFLVDSYYTWQELRKRSGNQIRAMEDEPHAAISWLFNNGQNMEVAVKAMLKRWSDGQELGRWATSIPGIGPVISAGLLAHIDMSHCPTVGHIWSFAGLDPTKTWDKGEKRPWNGKLKTLCWKIGESFVKVSGRDNDVYGKVYLERKTFEWENNLTGKLSDQATAAIDRRNIDKSTITYRFYSGQMSPTVIRRMVEAGTLIPQTFAATDEGDEIPMLPPAHIHSRAKRYAVKLFLAHFHHVAFVLANGEEPPKPYVIEHGGHTHYIAPPNWPME